MKAPKGDVPAASGPGSIRKSSAFDRVTSFLNLRRTETEAAVASRLPFDDEAEESEPEEENVVLAEDAS